MAGWMRDPGSGQVALGSTESRPAKGVLSPALDWALAVGAGAAWGALDGCVAGLSGVTGLGVSDVLGLGARLFRGSGLSMTLSPRPTRRGWASGWPKGASSWMKF